jgi:hypothetical protein
MATHRIHQLFEPSGVRLARSGAFRFAANSDWRKRAGLTSQPMRNPGLGRIRAERAPRVAVEAKLGVRFVDN